MTTPTPIRYVVIEGTVCDVSATGFDDSVVPLYVSAKHYDALKADLAAAQSALERERIRLAACGVVAMANTPESAAQARQMHEDYRSASLSDVERAVDAEMKLSADLAAAQQEAITAGGVVDILNQQLAAAQEALASEREAGEWQRGSRDQQITRLEKELAAAQTTISALTIQRDGYSKIIKMREEELAAAQEWKDRVIDELIVAHIYTKEHDANPCKAIQDAITWNCQVALDPAVSSDARALIANELRAVAAAQEALKAAEAHEAETHRTLGAILGNDDSLAQCAKRLCERARRAEERAERNARDAERKDGLLRECAYFMASFSEDCCIASSNLRQSCEHESAAIAGEGK